MIKTSALLCVRDNKMLLARVRDNTIWYFPGGKIDPGESHLQTVVREVYEELDVSLTPASLTYLGEVVTDNHDRTTTVSVQCYTCDITQPIIPSAEISELRWFDLDDTTLMAPAVIESIRRWFA
jgi:8-oxo-dGTP pyrophosphatase MutT (NUDIX family)